jgi:hypothetical protein
MKFFVAVSALLASCAAAAGIAAPQPTLAARREYVAWTEGFEE